MERPDPEVPEQVLSLLRSTLHSWLAAEQARSAMRQKVVDTLKELEAASVLILAVRQGAHESVIAHLQRAYDQAVLERRAHDHGTDEASPGPDRSAPSGGA